MLKLSGVGDRDCRGCESRATRTPGARLRYSSPRAGPPCLGPSTNKRLVLIEAHSHSHRTVEHVSLIADNAEQLPYVDGYFDVVTSVYLFHELPRNARRNVLREAHRVLRPGGLLVLEDSSQPSDSPVLAPVLSKFQTDFHEPFYKDYLEDDLAELAEECGFVAESSEPHLVAKVVVAKKPSH